MSVQSYLFNIVALAINKMNTIITNKSKSLCNFPISLSLALRYSFIATRFVPSKDERASDHDLGRGSSALLISTCSGGDVGQCQTVSIWALRFRPIPEALSSLLIREDQILPFLILIKYTFNQASLVQLRTCVISNIGSNRVVKVCLRYTYIVCFHENNNLRIIVCYKYSTRFNM